MSLDIPFSQAKYQNSFDFSGFEENPEARCACVLVLDTSGSMAGKAIEALNQGLQEFARSLEQDSLASKRVEIAIISFGPVQLVQDFVTADQFIPPILDASGSTPMGEAILKAIKMVQNRKEAYRQNGISYYRPWIFLITDGAPTDHWQQASEQIKAGETQKEFSFFSVAVEGADFSLLNRMSPRGALRLSGLAFTELFSWLSASVTAVSHSSTGDSIRLPQTTGWSSL